VGKCVKKADETTTTQYIHGADGQPFAILDPAYQTKPTYYLHGLDLIGQVNRDGSSLTRYHYLKDHLGSVRVRVNTSGSVMAYDDFYPYGQLMDGRSSNTGMPETRFKYTGKERDVESQYDCLRKSRFERLGIPGLFDSTEG